MMFPYVWDINRKSVSGDVSVRVERKTESVSGDVSIRVKKKIRVEFKTRTSIKIILVSFISQRLKAQLIVS